MNFCTHTLFLYSIFITPLAHFAVSGVSRVSLRDGAVGCMRFARSEITSERPANVIEEVTDQCW
jgi:hypothetical protein